MGTLIINDETGETYECPDLPKNPTKQMVFKKQHIGYGYCTLLKRISAGSQSQIYLAYNEHLKKQVIIKTIPPISQGGLKILTQLRHPNLPNVYDIVGLQNTSYPMLFYEQRCANSFLPSLLIMEYIKGWDLNRILKLGINILPDNILKYALQLCDVVEFLHNQNPPIIHGDIKPSNILISKKGDIFLIDFSISYLMTKNFSPIGYTKFYSPPELLKSVKTKHWNYSPIQADIYSIGATLFEMITRCKLYDVLLGKDFYIDLNKYNSSLLEAVDKATEVLPENRLKTVSDMKKILMSGGTKMYEYDIALSFAGEDRVYVEKVAKSLTKMGIRVFYDIYEQANLWGKDLYTHLADVYTNKAKYCIIFISQHYKVKLWTNHEMKSAFNRAFQSNTEYILPARFDDTEIVGLGLTVGYIDLRRTSPAQLAELARKKLYL